MTQPLNRMHQKNIATKIARVNGPLLDRYSVTYRIIIFNIVVLVIAFMIVKLSFRLSIARLIHDLVLNLLNLLNFCGFSKFPFVVAFFQTKRRMKRVIRTGPIRKITEVACVI